MPLSFEQKTELLKKYGFDPASSDLTDEGDVVPRQQTSVPGAVGANVARAIPGAITGGLAARGATAAAQRLGIANPWGLAGIGALAALPVAVGTMYAQKPIERRLGASPYLEAAQLQHPYGSAIGNLAGAFAGQGVTPGWMPAKALASNIAKQIGLRQGMVTAPESAAGIQATVGGTIGAGQMIAEQGFDPRKWDPAMAAIQIGGGMIPGDHPAWLAKRYPGVFPRPDYSADLSKVPVDPKIGQQVRTSKPVRLSELPGQGEFKQLPPLPKKAVTTDPDILEIANELGFQQKHGEKGLEWTLKKSKESIGKDIGVSKAELEKTKKRLEKEPMTDETRQQLEAFIGGKERDISFLEDAYTLHSKYKKGYAADKAKRAQLQSEVNVENAQIEEQQVASKFPQLEAIRKSTGIEKPEPIAEQDLLTAEQKKQQYPYETEVKFADSDQPSQLSVEDAQRLIDDQHKAAVAANDPAAMKITDAWNKLLTRFAQKSGVSLSTQAEGIEGPGGRRMGGSIELPAEGGAATDVAVAKQSAFHGGATTGFHEFFHKFVRDINTHGSKSEKNLLGRMMKSFGGNEEGLVQSSAETVVGTILNPKNEWAKDLATYIKTKWLRGGNQKDFARLMSGWMLRGTAPVERIKAAGQWKGNVGKTTPMFQDSEGTDVFDAKDGIGSVPWNQDVNYRGFVKQLTSDEFRALVPKGSWGGEKSKEFFVKALKKGKKLGQPFLELEWKEDHWQVADHEGRSRVDAIKEVFGSDFKIPVHMFLRGGLRARDLTPEMLSAPLIKQKLSSEAQAWLDKQENKYQQSEQQKGGEYAQEEMQGKETLTDKMEPDTRYAPSSKLGPQPTHPKPEPEQREWFTPRLQILKEKGGPSAELANVLEQLSHQERQLIGQYMNGMLEAKKLGRLTNEQFQRIYEEVLLKEKTDPTVAAKIAAFTPGEQIAYQKLRDVYKQMAIDQIAADHPNVDPAGNPKVRGVDPKGWFRVPSSEVIKILTTKGEGDPAFDFYRDEFLNAQYNAMGTTNPTPEQQAFANKRFQEMIGSFGKFFGSVKNEFSFGPTELSEGVPLPDSWVEPDFQTAIRRYTQRFALSRAFHDQIRKNPQVAVNLNQLNDPWKKPYAATQQQNLLANQDVNRLLNNITGRGNVQMPVFSTLSRAASSAVLGNLATTYRDVSSTTPNMLRMMPNMFNPFGLGKMLLYTAKHLPEGWRHSFETGINKRSIDMLDDLYVIHDQFGQKMNKLANWVTRYSGRELGEQFARAKAQTMGEYLAQTHKTLAASGDNKSIQLLDRVAQDWSTLSTEELGTRFAQLAQGRYDAASTPQWMIDSHIAPFMRLQRWNVEQWNTFKRQAWDPLKKDGNPRPMLQFLASGLLGGLINYEVASKIMGSISYVPSWKEIENMTEEEAWKAYGYKLGSAAQLSGVMGFVSDILFRSMQFFKGNATQPFSFPLQSVASGLTTTFANAIKAIGDGENPDQVMLAAGADGLSQLLTQVRLARNQYAKHLASPEEPAAQIYKKRQQTRDLRVFEQWNPDYKSAVSSRPGLTGFNPYEDFTEKRMDLAQTPEQINRLGGELNRRLAGSRNPMELQKMLRKFDTIPMRQIPSHQNDPIKFMEYYNWIAKTQGPEKANALMEDYVRQRILTEQKRDAIRMPSR